MDIDAKKQNHSDKHRDEKKNGKGSGGHNNGDHIKGDNNKKGVGNSSDNMCRLHDGKHVWKDCPSNRFSKNYDEAKAKKERENRYRSKGGKANSVANVAVKEVTSSVLFAADFDYKTDNDSVRKVNEDHFIMNNEAAKCTTKLAPVTVVAMSKKKGGVQACTGLLDQCFTDRMIISEECARTLGYGFIEVPEGERSQGIW